MTAFKFSSNFDQDFIVSKGILEYLAGMDQSEEWEVRGVAGKNSKAVDELQEERQKKLQNKMEQNSFRQKVIEFANDVAPLLEAFINNDRGKVDEYMDDWDFYFVAGPPRSGGTYVYTQVSEAVEWPWDQLLRTMTHDHIPHGNLIRGKQNQYGNIGWRIPDRYRNFVFQLSTFIEYARREAQDANSIVLKNMGFCHSFRMLDQLLPERAHYLVTVRHPAAVSASRAETWEGQENTEKFRRGCFQLWYNLYSEVLRDGVPEADLQMLEFGDPMDKYLDDLHEQKSSLPRDDKIRPTSRDYDSTFWEQDEFQEKINWLKEFYALHGLKFPMPETIK